jgi:Ca2+-binding RTX toxin-like protein
VPCWSFIHPSAQKGYSEKFGRYGLGGDDQVDALGGDDNAYGDTGNDTIYGGEGWDTLDGGHPDSPEPGNDRLFGGVGQDSLYGDDGNDFLHGGAATDAFFDEGGKDQIKGGSGSDRIETGLIWRQGFATPDGVVDTVDCGSGTDTVYFQKGSDKINANCEIKKPYR